MRDDGVDVVYKEVSDDEYKNALQAAGLPDLLVSSLSQNMGFIRKYEAFSVPGLELGHSILEEPLETFAEFLAGGGLAALK